jgi:hypothetical protein
MPGQGAAREYAGQQAIKKESSKRNNLLRYSLIKHRDSMGKYFQKDRGRQRRYKNSLPLQC